MLPGEDAARPRQDFIRSGRTSPSSSSTDEVPPLSPSLRSNSFPGVTGRPTRKKLTASSSTQSLRSCLPTCQESISSVTVSEQENKNTALQRGMPFSKFITRVGKTVGAVMCILGWRYKKMRLQDHGFRFGLIGGGLLGFYMVKRYRYKVVLKTVRSRIFNMEFEALSGADGASATTSAVPNNVKNRENSTSPALYLRGAYDLAKLHQVHFLNETFKKLWGVYSEAVCNLIEESVTPLLESVKPSFIRRIEFSELTFGTIPFFVTHVKCLEEAPDEFVLEAGIRWHGENAAVALMVALRGGGEVEAKVDKLVFSGTVKVSFTPLVPFFPGFGALTVALTAPPLVHFEASVGGLQMVSDTIEKFLQSFLVEHIFGNLLVWPNRLVVPILPPEERGPIDHLYLRTKGMLRVVVKGAQGLSIPEGQNGHREHVHPFVTLETVPLQVFCTKVLPSTTNPVWNEEHFLKVQEVEQSLRVVLLDDHFDPAGIASNTKSRGRKLGMCVIPLASLPIGETVDRWFDLGTRSWVEDSLPVRSKHHGPDVLSEEWYASPKLQGNILDPIGDKWAVLIGYLSRVVPTSISTGPARINLGLTYIPLDHLRKGFFPVGGSKKGRTHRGLLFVQVVRAFNIVSLMRKDLTSSYCVIRLGNTNVKKTRVVRDSVDPEWNENFEWYDVCVEDLLVVEIFNSGSFMDTSLGFVKIYAETLAQKRLESGTNMVELTLELHGGMGDVQMQVDWVPLDNNPIARKMSRKRESGMTRLSPSPPRGQLLIKLLNARDLDGSDWSNARGTYCIVKIQGADQKSSCSASNPTPTWLQAFSWESVKALDVLHIAIYAKGSILMADTFLGRCTLKIEDLAREANSVHLIIKSLCDKNMELPVGGMVSLQACWLDSNNQHKPIDTMQWPEPHSC